MLCFLASVFLLCPLPTRPYLIRRSRVRTGFGRKNSLWTMESWHVGTCHVPAWNMKAHSSLFCICIHCIEPLSQFRNQCAFVLWAHLPLLFRRHAKVKVIEMIWLKDLIQPSTESNICGNRLNSFYSWFLIPCDSKSKSGYNSKTFLGHL